MQPYWRNSQEVILSWCEYTVVCPLYLLAFHGLICFLCMAFICSFSLFYALSIVSLSFLRSVRCPSFLYLFSCLQSRKASGRKKQPKVATDVVSEVSSHISQALIRSTVFITEKLYLCYSAYLAKQLFSCLQDSKSSSSRKKQQSSSSGKKSSTDPTSSKQLYVVFSPAKAKPSTTSIVISSGIGSDHCFSLNSVYTSVEPVSSQATVSALGLQ